MLRVHERFLSGRRADATPFYVTGANAPLFKSFAVTVAGPSRASPTVQGPEAPSRPGSSEPSAPGTTVSTGRTFPTSVPAPVLLESLKITGRVRPALLIHRVQALLRS